MTLALLLRWWKETAIAVLLLAVVFFYERAQTRAEERGVLRERSRGADSTIRAQAPTLAKTDTLIVRDTVRVTRLLAAVHTDTLWRRDTVRVPGDTTPRLAVPLPTVARWDSTGRACQELAGDCAAFRVAAKATIGALETKVAALEQRPPRSCAGWFWAGVATGGSAGIYADRRMHR